MERNGADEPLTGTANVTKQLSLPREEVERARGAPVQTWLASMPPNEELHRLCAELAAAKARLAATAAEIPPLKSLIEATTSAAAARQAEAGKKQAAAEELRRRVDPGRAELRRARAELAAARGAKDALERRVLVRLQAARAMQLAERAVAAEARAAAWAAEQAARAGGDGDDARRDHDVVTVPARRLEELRGTVEAAEMEAEARVREAEAMRRAAKARRAAAVARLDAARARRREAEEDALRRVNGGGDEGHGKRARRVTTLRRRSGMPCFTVKKLRGFLCRSIARA